MSDPKKSRNYAVAKGPVNRRTAVPASVPREPVAQSVRARVSMARARHRLGAPLSQRLSLAPYNASQAKRLGALAIVQTIGATVCATGLGLGVIQGSVWIMGASATALASVALWAVISRRSSATETPPPTLTMTEVVDAETLERLDGLMEQMSAQASQVTVDRLAKLKESIARCVSLVATAWADAGPSCEEALYLGEAVRRYIPDSISSCLKVPHKDRANLVIDGCKPALDLLHDQLDLIQQQLDSRELKLTQFAGEALMRQQRFLAAKSAERR